MLYPAPLAIQISLDGQYFVYKFNKYSPIINITRLKFHDHLETATDLLSHSFVFVSF